MRVRFLILLVFLAVMGGIGATAVWRTGAGQRAVIPLAIKPEVVRCEAFQERPYQVIESFHGLIQAHSRVDMAFQIPGRISKLGTSREHPIRNNDRVEEGQILATLEPLRFEAAQQAANAKMEEAKAAMAQAQAQIADAQARLADAQHEAERVADLAHKGAAAQREVEKADLAVKLIQAQLDGVHAQLASASAGYDSSRAASTMAEVNLQDATLRAPMNALVASVPVEVGQTVTPAQPVMTLVDLSRMKLILGVVKRKLPLLHQGQQVTVQVQALAAQAALLGGDSEKLARPRAGLITIVPPAADPMTGLFMVEVDLPNPDGLLRPGMVGKASVVVAEKRAIALPAEAVGHTGEDYWAFFTAPGFRTGLDLGGVGKTTVNLPEPVAHKVIIKPVVVDKEFFLVTDLPTGFDRVVIEGQSRLTDGQPVTVLNETLTAAAPTQ